MSVKLFYLVAVAGILGCAAAGGSSATAGTPPVPKNPKLLTAEDIAVHHADVATAYDAVARLRPNWLASHGAMSSDPTLSPYATVWVDGQHFGDISALRNIPAYQVEAIRYYDITEAGAKFGLRAGYGGAIEVKSRLK
jgi:hypothetical protein